MVDEQEALEIAADLLTAKDADCDTLLDPAAAMLRKLVAEREADRAAMREALEALKYHTEQTRPIVATQVAIHHLRQRLEGTT